MDEHQRGTIEQRLIRERTRSRVAMGRYKQAALTSLAGSASELTQYPTHMADQASDMLEREMSLFFASKEGRHLHQIEEALRRLYENRESFGSCQECGVDIPFLRLDAVPYTVACVDCQQSTEGAGARGTSAARGPRGVA